MLISNALPILDPTWSRNVHILAGQQKRKYYTLDADEEGKLIGISRVSYGISLFKPLVNFNSLPLYNPSLRVISAIEKTLNAVKEHLTNLNHYILEHPAMSEAETKLCRNQLFIYPKRAQFSVETVRKENLLNIGSTKTYHYEFCPKFITKSNVSGETIQRKKQDVINVYLSVFENLHSLSNYNEIDTENQNIVAFLQEKGYLAGHE